MIKKYLSTIIALITVSSLLAAPDVSSDVPLGKEVIITVTADGTPPLSYQWEKSFNGVFSPVPGATTNVLSIKNITASDVGEYRAIISNPFGSINSPLATIKIAKVPNVESFTVTVK